jgi:hypothetical protein
MSDCVDEIMRLSSVVRLDHSKVNPMLLLVLTKTLARGGYKFTLNINPWGVSDCVGTTLSLKRRPPIGQYGAQGIECRILWLLQITLRPKHVCLLHGLNRARDRTLVF